MWAELLVAVVLARSTAVLPLEGGDTLVVVSDARVPLVEVQLMLPAGHLSPWWQQADAAAAWQLPLTDLTLKDRLEQVCDLTLSHDDWSTTLTARSLRSDLPELRAALGAFLEGGSPDRAVLRQWRHTGNAPWLRASRHPWAVLSRLVARQLLPTGDLRRTAPSAPTARLRQLTRTRRTLLSLPDRIVGFAGDVSSEEAQDFAQGLLPVAAAPPRNLAPRTLPAAPLPPSPSRPMWQPGAGRAWVLLARTGPSRTDPRSPALLVALHVLAGEGRSRLYNLRHNSGLIYTLLAEYRPGHPSGMMLIAAAARPSLLAEVTEQAHGIVSEFAAHGITESERDAAISALMLQLELAEQRPGGALTARMTEQRHKLPAHFTAEQIASAEQAPLSEINDFIAEFFAPTTLLTLQVLPRPELPL